MHFLIDDWNYTAKLLQVTIESLYGPVISIQLNSIKKLISLKLYIGYSSH